MAETRSQRFFNAVSSRKCSRESRMWQKKADDCFKKRFKTNNNEPSPSKIASSELKQKADEPLNRKTF